MQRSKEDLYDPQFVSGMFDRMSKTYGFANLITSFGFTARWRRQCIQDLPEIGQTAKGFDLMSGMGEAWPELQKIVSAQGQIVAVDISAEMNTKAHAHLKRLSTKNIVLKKANVLVNDIPSSSADYVVSTFGLKTFDKAQQQTLAGEVNRILKPGGSFSFIEISKPQSPFLKWVFMIYLKVFIPLIGRLFLGNSEDYRMLGIYCGRFSNSKFFADCLAELGLNTRYRNYFFGCATGVNGTKELLKSEK